MSDFLGNHIDGTSGVERGCNTDWTLVERGRKARIFMCHAQFLL